MTQKTARCWKVAVALAAWLAVGMAAPAQNPDMMSREESTTRGKDLIAKAIAALGGQPYLKVRDIECAGRLAQFSSSGDLAGFVKIFDFALLPDKNRTEYFDKRNVIDVNNGSEGWTLDRAGIEDFPVGRGEAFLEGLMKNMDHLFRNRLDEEGLVIRYGGSDLMDLKQVEWVEVQDSERRVTRIAFDVKTHLPTRAVYQTRDRETREVIEETEYFSLYKNISGVQIPFQIGRDRNGRKVFQVFWNSCKVNTGVSESYFTRASLEQVWAKIGPKKK